MPVQRGVPRVLRHLASPGALSALIWKNIAYPFSPQAAERRYDRSLGIDTAGYIEPSQMGITGEAASRSLQYDPTPPAIAQFLIAAVAPRARGFTFVDIGSGKGRVLLIAARFGFARVVGFEHSAMLNAVACENIRRSGARNPGLAPVELVTGDATRLPLPAGPLVLFLYNPFGREAVREFAASVNSSWRNYPRKIICIYYNFAHPEEFDRLGIFPVRRMVDCPPDPRDRYGHLKFQALIFETGEP